MAAFAARLKPCPDNAEKPRTARGRQRHVYANCVFSGLADALSHAYDLGADLGVGDLSGHGFSRADGGKKYCGFSR